MKLTTIWLAYNKVTVDILLGISLSKRIRQYVRFGDVLAKHFKEWDEDMEALEHLAWKETTVQDFLGLSDDEMEDIEARLIDG